MVMEIFGMRMISGFHGNVTEQIRCQILVNAKTICAKGIEQCLRGEAGEPVSKPGRCFNYQGGQMMNGGRKVCPSFITDDVDGE